MSLSRCAPLWALYVCLCVLSFGAASAAEPAKQKSPKDMVLIGDAVCTKCHDEAEDYPVLSIAKTRHGVTADARNPTCTSCHGESAEHARKASDKDRPKPDVTYDKMYASVPEEGRVDRYFGRFGKGTDTPVAERNKACLNCHQGGMQIFWQFADGSPFIYGTASDGTRVTQDPKQSATFVGVSYRYRF